MKVEELQLQKNNFHLSPHHPPPPHPPTLIPFNQQNLAYKQLSVIIE